MGDILRKLTDAWLLQGARSYQEPRWRPSVDIYRCGAGWLVKFELAGVRPEDIELQLRGRRLLVSGMRRDSCITQGKAWSMEIAYNRFERAVELPCDLDGVTIDSEYQDGMLLVTVKTEHGR